MDEHTLEKLEYDGIRRLLAQQAACGLGRELAMRIEPARRPALVTTWLDQTRQFARWVELHGLPPFGGIRDVRELVRRAVPPAKLEPEEFAELASTLNGADAVRHYFAGLSAEFDHVDRVARRIGDFHVIADRINRVIDSRGRVRDDASERLERIRREIEKVKEQTRGVFDHLVRQPGVTRLLQYPSATFHADRMVLPLKSDQRGRVPGIVHRSSDSGQTLFIEPAEAVELNNVRIRLITEETEEIGRILWELTHLVHLNQAELLRTLGALAVVDLLSAKIRMARRYAMHVPAVDGNRPLRLVRARNPVLMATFEQESGEHESKREVVPIDVRLGDDFDVMLITGPNTGGKTATLKTVGLLALMAQSGLPIPADEGSRLPVFDAVFIDVGDEQSLQQSLSTFSAHLARILDICRRAQPHSLVLLDELGAGTDPDEGAAIGRAVVDKLRSLGCLAMITTHLGALKAVGYEQKRVDNASVQFDVNTLRPTYELRIGEPGNSNAIEIATRLGMPAKMAMAARRHLTQRSRALTKAIEGTLHSRREAERARLDAERARQDAARATLAAMDREAALEAERRKYAAWVQRVMSLQPGDEVHVRTFDRTGRVVRIHLERQTAVVNLGAMEIETAISDLVLDGAAKGAVAGRGGR